VNSMYVLDASVVIKWFSDEEFTDKAVEIRNDFFKGKNEVVVPDLLLYEVSNALRYNPNFDENDVAEAVNSLFDLGMSIIVPTQKVLKSAINLGFERSITIYDSFYVALAKEINFTFITADRKLYQKTKDLSFVKFVDEI